MNKQSAWSLKRIRYLFKERNDKGHPNEEPLAATQHAGVVPKTQLDFKTMEAVTSDLSLFKLVKPGDFVISLRSFEGGLEYSGYRGLLSPAYSVLTPSGEVHPGFFKYLLKSSGFVQSLGKHKKGIRDGQAVPFSTLRDDYLSIPDWSTQQRIANFLDEHTARIDALIAEEERLVEALKDVEEVTAFDLVTRGLNSGSPKTSYREPWLKELPAHWLLHKVRHLATVGNGSTPKRDNDAYWSGGELPWLNSSATNTPRITEASDFVTAQAVKECHLPTVRQGSTVVALTGQGKTRGTAAFVEFQTTINQHLAYISVIDSTMSDEYLWVALTGFYSVLRAISEGEGSTKGALTCEQLSQFRLPVPPLGEQTEIVSAYKKRVNAIKKLQDHVKTHIDRLREYRSSLISAAVTGQLDLGTFKGLPNEQDRHESSPAERAAHECQPVTVSAG